MPAINIVIENDVPRSTRCRQLEAMFDVPPEEKSRIEWCGDLPIDKGDWNVGLIVGPSGCGKSVIGKDLFADNYEPQLSWGGGAVVDDFPAIFNMEQITQACQSVGFNTIPAWLRPHSVLSNGEKFRVEMARRLLEHQSPIVVDEFTSVVDRQVAQIGSHAVQKYVRKHKKQFVAITCHYDVIDWLQPDWVFEPAAMKFTATRGSLRRPELKGEIKRVGYEMWRVFAPYHYMSASLNKAARCFALYVDGHPAAFAAVLHRPNNRVNDIKGISRLVTLPDWQGLGIAFRLVDALGSAYMAEGYRLRTYPAHPSLIRAFDKSRFWKLTKKPGLIQKTRKGVTAKYNPNKVCRPGAVFQYAGVPMEKEGANALINNAL